MFFFTNVRSYSFRVSQNINREVDEVVVDIGDLERWRDRIFDAIHSGFIIVNVITKLIINPFFFTKSLQNNMDTRYLVYSGLFCLEDVARPRASRNCVYFLRIMSTQKRKFIKQKRRVFVSVGILKPFTHKTEVHVP